MKGIKTMVKSIRTKQYQKGGHSQQTFFLSWLLQKQIILKNERF